MRGLLKLSVLSVGFLAGVAGTASAQAVSTLPPAGAAPTVTAPPPVTSSPQSFNPKPGGNSAWQDQHYQPPAGYDADKSQHPYSTSIGPKPGSHSSGDDVHYQATDQDSNPSRHPYTTSGMGPRPH